MKNLFQLLFSLILGAIALTLIFTLMLRYNTAPANGFAYLLFFTTLRFIATFTLTRERVLQFFVTAILCMAASFWALRSSALWVWDSPVWERHDASPYSIAWRSIAALACVLAVPRYASQLVRALGQALPSPRLIAID